MDEQGHDVDQGGAKDISRRTLLGGAGVALASGVALAAGGAAVLPQVAGATGGDGVASGPTGTTAIEFVARIDQTGADFRAYGYLTSVAGLDNAELFSDPDNRSETTALLTAFATGSLVARSVDGAVHSLDIEGSLSVYRRSGPGASFGDPLSFSSGRKLATYTLDLQDVLTVIDTGRGLPTLTGDMRQTFSGGAGRGFGRPGMRLRFFATGLGQRSDSGPLNNAQANLSVAGNMTVE